MTAHGQARSAAGSRPWPAHHACAPAERRAALLRVIVLLGLSAWVFLPELMYCCRLAVRQSSAGHAVAVPAAIAALLYLRRRWLAAELSKGSLWGVVGIVVGLLMFALGRWPFAFQYVQHLAMIPVFGGAILAGAGWRIAKRCLPMLILLFLAIPIGQRIYARLIIRPETYTLSASRLILDRLPGVQVRLDGPDLHFSRHGQAGTIALGEANRGASLLLAYLVVGVFVVFARVRPFWQVSVLAMAAGPVVLGCNLLRLLMWGFVTIYGGCGPTSPVPRLAAGTVSLLAAYGVFVVLCAILDNLVVDEENESEAESEGVTHAG